MVIDGPQNVSRRLNEECFCITIDHAGLQRGIASELGDAPQVAALMLRGRTSSRARRSSCQPSRSRRCSGCGRRFPQCASGQGSERLLHRSGYSIPPIRGRSLRGGCRRRQRAPIRSGSTAPGWSADRSGLQPPGRFRIRRIGACGAPRGVLECSGSCDTASASACAPR